MSRCVMGLDLSLAGTGVVVVNEAGGVVWSERIVTRPETPTLERFGQIVTRVGEVKDRLSPCLAVIERPALAHVNRGSAALIGLHYVVRWERGDLAELVVSPGSLKNFVTGKGNAQKDLMRLKVYKRWGVEFASTDETDAYALAQYGWAHLRGEVKEKGRKRCKK